MTGFFAAGRICASWPSLRELAVFAPKEEVLSGLRNGTLTDKYEKAIEGGYHNAMRLNQHDATRESLSNSLGR